MADFAQFSFPLFFLLSLLLHITVSADPPQISPSPSLSSPALSPSPSPSPLASSPAPSVHAPNSAPASSPLGLSPPAPSPANQSPTSSPSPAPTPEPADRSIVGHTGVSDTGGKADSSSGGKKAGIAIGVITAAGVVVLAALVYKKRRQNIRRSQYGYAARREIL